MVKRETWIDNRWRPMMAWQYTLTCAFDFVLAPILWSIIQVLQKGDVTLQWNPITLQGAGLYHLAMGGILGVAAWSRGQEKMTEMRSTSVTETRQINRTSRNSNVTLPDTDCEDADHIKK